MDHQQYKIFKNAEDYSSENPCFTLINGKLDLVNCLLLGDDGQSYSLNYAAIAINDVLADIDMNVPEITYKYLVPVNDIEWFTGYFKDEPDLEHVFSVKDDVWYMFNAGKYKPVSHDRYQQIELRKPKKKLIHCFKIIKCGMDASVLNTLVHETDKYYVERMGTKQLRHTKLTSTQNSIPLAFAKDEHGEITGYIYKA